MKIETASMLNCERRNSKYAQLWKEGPQVCLTMKIETGSMLNNENGNCNMLNYGRRRCKHA